ncbi:MAG: hypothetical protein QXV17_13605 [Candidatus Micrarchaeaceae archaeon]
MENVTQIQIQTPTPGANEKEELLKIAKRLGPVQIQVITALAANGGKLPFHEHEGGEDDAIDNYTRTTLSVYYTTLKAYRVVRSLERKGLAELVREDCKYHKGRVKMYVYLTAKGHKLAQLINNE